MSNKLIMVKKGFPTGIIFIKERLHPLVNKIHKLSDKDIGELDAFINYLIEGPDKLSVYEDEKSLKIFDFMDGGMRKTG